MTEDDDLKATASAEVQAEPENKSEPSAPAKPDADGKKDMQAPEQEAEGEADKTPPEGAKKKHTSGLVKNREKIAELEQTVAELQARIAASDKAPAPPKFEDFTDFDAYEAAKIKHAVTAALGETQKASTEKDLEAAREAYFKGLAEAHEARTAEARERIPDYDKTLAKYVGPKPSEAIVEFLYDSDKSELLALHLATRPKLVAELNALPPERAAREIGRIEARLSYPQPKTQTDAPPPVGALRGGSSPAVDPSKMSFAEFKAWREKGGTIGARS